MVIKPIVGVTDFIKHTALGIKTIADDPYVADVKHRFPRVFYNYQQYFKDYNYLDA